MLCKDIYKKRTRKGGREKEREPRTQNCDDRESAKRERERKEKGGEQREE